MSESEYEILDDSNNEPLIEQEKNEPKSDTPKTEKKDDEEEEKNILMFKSKSVDICKVIGHLSTQLDIFFMVFGAICTAGSGCVSSFSALLLGSSINKLTVLVGIENLDNDAYQAKIASVEPTLNKLIMGFIYLALFTLGVNFFMLFLWGYAAMRQMNTLKTKYFKLILSQEQSFFDANNSFEFANKIQSQLEQIELGLGDRFSQIILMLAETISGLTIGFLTSWKLSLVICASFPIIVISVVISDFFSKKLVLKAKDLNESAGGIAEELLYNIKTVTSFCNFEWELNRYNQVIDEMNKYDQKRVMIQAIAFGLLYIATFVSIAGSFLLAAKLITKKEINHATKQPYNSGDIITVLASVLNVVYSISGLGPNIQIIQKSAIAAGDYFYLLSHNQEKKVSLDAICPPRDTFKGRIEFKNVKFVYPHDNAQKVILDNFNLTIEPGKKIAIVGESGCGKSTTINLIERLYDPVEGEILIDGINIKKYDLNYLRDLIGYVQQEPVLFNFSIKDNIIFGREKKLEKLGDINSMIREACADAHIKDFIERNEDKYDYIVGIKGSRLSGGQRQRIAIARAILMKPKILILDEATSSLDNRSERQVQRALDNITQKNITTIVIAHRLSTIKNSDLIYVMNKGKIIERGTHDELLELNGSYAALVKSQLSPEEIVNLNLKLKNKNRSKDSNSVEVKDTFKDEDIALNDIETAPSRESILFAEKEKGKVKIEKRKLWSLISDNKCDLVIGIIAGLLYGAMAPCIGLVMGKSVNALASPDPDQLKKGATKYFIVFLCLGIFGGFAIFIRMWKLQSLGLTISIKVKKKIIEKYLELNMSFFDIDTNSPGSLATKLAIDSNQLDSLILDLVGGILSVVSSLVISFVLGAVYNIFCTLVLYVFLPFIIYGMVKKGDYAANGRESNKLLKIEAGNILSESVVNIKTIFSFNFQKRALELYGNILNTEKKEFLKGALMQGFCVGLGLSADYFGIATMLKLSITLLKKRKTTFEKLMNCLYSISNSVDSLTSILRNMGDSKKAKLAYKSIYDTLDTEVTISPFYNNNWYKISPENIKGKIEFKNVTFSYPTKPDKIILKDLSFKINAGENVAVVGLSGSGKSTIVQLIERFYDVNKGEILLDGKNIKEYNLYELRRKIGLVLQEPSIFKRNLYDNILYGKLDSKRENVLDVAKRAKIEHKLMVNDYEDNKNPLSGGEKQRAAMARAFLKDPAIILMDESTSAMDKETENEVLHNFFQIMKGKTCINVSHRLSSIIDSDVILVLDQGKLVERGNHQELIKLKGKYYTLYNYSEI
jgi:ATP-binding cassette subfamily B (MDR/TAP) protein 1